MNKQNPWLKMSLSAILSALMAGSAVCALMAALELPFAAAKAYGFALAASALCGCAAFSGVAAIAAAAGAAALLGGAALMHAQGFSQLAPLWSALTNPEAETAATWSEGCALVSIFLPALMAALLFVLVDHRGGTPFALAVFLALLICSYALCPTLSLRLAVPGALAALTAFALSSGMARDAGAWRALIPAVVAVCAAFLLVPEAGTVWEPMENAAGRVRAAFEDYFRFTQERIPFTISTEGYDHAAEENGAVVTRLGGPATPDPTEVMRVTADGDVLLRGSIRRTYTGHAWIDDDPKARYLYYDFTRRSLREEVFGMDGNALFEPVNVSVEMLREGTSTLFVPGRLADFSMNLDNAVYYNSIGEMFLSRNVRPGDAYSLTGYRVADAQTLRSAALAVQEQSDDAYDEALRSCTQLPEGIEEGVYALTMRLTQDTQTAADKALAIQSWLRENCVYTLSPDYPDASRDFVSQFVLDTKEGYCSHFATAMTVMCRIAGLPARYVEGYSVHGGENVAVTGENAHAWTEVYFRGLGWIALDAGNGAGGGRDGLSTQAQGDAVDDVQDAPQSGDESATVPPQEEPTLPPDDGANEPTPTPQGTLPPDDSASPTPTPTPEPDDFGGADEPTPEPSSPPDRLESSSNPPEPEKDSQENRAWLWIVCIALILLLLIALMLLLARRRLRQTDPLYLSAQADAETAMLILYRSLLTLLQCAGQSPLSGETPSAFARRVCDQTENPDFEAFASAVERSVYARADVSEQTLSAGRRAYASFVDGMTRSERLRFAWTRLTRGLGGFDAIP